MLHGREGFPESLSLAVAVSRSQMEVRVGAERHSKGTVELSLDGVGSQLKLGVRLGNLVAVLVAKGQCRVVCVVAAELDTKRSAGKVMTLRSG
jgi:hypothetical protein